MTRRQLFAWAWIGLFACGCSKHQVPRPGPLREAERLYVGADRWATLSLRLGPDGRAEFTFETDVQGEPVVGVYLGHYDAASAVITLRVMGRDHVVKVLVDDAHVDVEGQPPWGLAPTRLDRR